MIWLPTVYEGLSDVIGSWKIMAISPPRMERMSSPMGSSVVRSMDVDAEPLVAWPRLK